MGTDATFVFADLAGFTALTEAHGDDDAAGLAERFYAMTEACLVGDARLVKTIGDAVMLVAPAPLVAIDVATKLVAAAAATAAFPELRAGIHAGPAVERHGDYLGATVNLAARVASHARGGQILCTEPIAVVAAAAGRRVEPLGPVRFKNVSDPVPIFELTREAERAATCPVCKMTLGHDAIAVIVHGETHHVCSEACGARLAARA